MAKTKSTRRQAESSPTVPAEQARLELIGVRAAVITAVSTLQTRSPMDQALATVLIRIALQPLDRILEEVAHG